MDHQSKQVSTFMLKTRYHWIGSNALILKYLSFFLSVYCLLDTHTDHSLNSALVYNFLAIKMLICHNLMPAHFDNEVHMLSCQFKVWYFLKLWFLQSGRMYYLNRKTLRKSWNWPKKQKLDLELNMSSTIPNCPDECSSSNSSLEDSNNKNHASSNSNMVALACLNCHLLVIFSKSSPYCPNCKYVHSFPTLQSPQRKVSPTRSLSTLSLLN